MLHAIALKLPIRKGYDTCSSLFATVVGSVFASHFVEHETRMVQMCA